MIDAPTLTALYDRWKASERAGDPIRTMIDHSRYQQSLIVNARAASAMRGR